MGLPTTCARQYFSDREKIKMMSNVITMLNNTDDATQLTAYFPRPFVISGVSTPKNVCQIDNSLETPTVNETLAPDLRSLTFAMAFNNAWAIPAPDDQPVSNSYFGLINYGVPGNTGDGTLTNGGFDFLGNQLPFANYFRKFLADSFIGCPTSPPDAEPDLGGSWASYFGEFIQPANDLVNFWVQEGATTDGLTFQRFLAFQKYLFESSSGTLWNAPGIYIIPDYTSNDFPAITDYLSDQSGSLRRLSLNVVELDGSLSGTGAQWPTTSNFVS